MTRFKNSEGQDTRHQVRNQFEEPSVVHQVRVVGSGVVREKGGIEAKNTFTVGVLNRLIPGDAVVCKRNQHESSENDKESQGSPIVKRVASHDNAASGESIAWP